MPPEPDRNHQLDGHDEKSTVAMKSASEELGNDLIDMNTRVEASSEKSLPALPVNNKNESSLIDLEPTAAPVETTVKRAEDFRPAEGVVSGGDGAGSSLGGKAQGDALGDLSQQTAHLSLLDDTTETEARPPALPSKNELPAEIQEEITSALNTTHGIRKGGSDRPSTLLDNEHADSEIQSIMEQFDDQEGVEEHPRSPTELPPRMSSLEKVQSSSSMKSGAPSLKNANGNITGKSSRAESIRSLSFSNTGRFSLAEGTQPLSPQASSPSIHKALPPAPDPDLPFDFHRFLDQLRHRTADPVAKFLRSFLFEFGKKQWMVHEQIKIISDFLTFITGKMGQCEVWREVSDAEFDNAKEGMEKLVMNRLYSQTYSPAIPGPVSSPTKGKRKGNDRPTGSFRRGQHQEDIDRDAILAQKVRIYGWVKPEHLDIPKVEDSSNRFIKLAQQELLKIESYRAPRDKVICVLNCCKVIFGLLKNSKSTDTSADAFMPFLIYVTLQANPEHLVSNIQYILRFRNPDKLGGEAGYYISSLMGAIQFIENLDRTSLTITDEEFEKNVELAVSAIAEKQPEIPEETTTRQAEFNEKMEYSRPGANQAMMSPGMRSPVRTDSEKEYDANDEKAVIGGILKSFQRPLTNIGRMFSDEGSSSQFPAQQQQQLHGSLPPHTPRGLSPSMIQPPPGNSEESTDGSLRTPRSPRRISAEDAAARQASAEAAEAQRITRAEHKDVVDTLAGMFPNLDREIIDDVVRMKEGRIGSAVDACLALNTGA